MPIVTSTHTVGHPQTDGRRYVIEAHTDSAGQVHPAEYLAAAGADYTAVRAARAVVIGEGLAEAEAQALADNAT